MKKCSDEIIQAIEIAQEHLNQPDEIVDNKSYWQEVYETNIKRLRVLLFLEKIEKTL